MTTYLCTLIEMYDGREFIYDQYLVTTDQNIHNILEKHVENLTNQEDSDWAWDGKWWCNYGESAYTIGSVTEIPATDVGTLSKYFNVTKV